MLWLNSRLKVFSGLLQMLSFSTNYTKVDVVTELRRQNSKAFFMALGNILHNEPYCILLTPGLLSMTSYLEELEILAD